VKPLIAIAAVALAAAPTALAGGSVTVPLHPVNGSGQSGVAILTTTKTGYTVVVRIRGRSVQPGEHDHIHNLTCARYAKLAPHPKAPTAAQIGNQLATVVEGLTDIENGVSRTQIPAPLADVLTGTYSVNVHQPGDPYTALVCGNIPKR
jgi:hypothetical protein